MTRRVQIRWLIGAVLGILVAICAGFVLIPTTLPQPDFDDVVVMDDPNAGEVIQYRPSAPAQAEAQPVPALEDVPADLQSHWEQTSDRADWIGGATVVCDLGELAGESRNAFMDMDRGLEQSGGVDVLSRMYTPVVDGMITFAVREPSGEARVLLNTVDEAQFDGNEGDGTVDDAVEVEPPRLDLAPIRIAWAGATEGKTVGCHAVYASEPATLEIYVEDSEGNPFSGITEAAGSMPDAVVVRGCGFMLPQMYSPIVLDVEAGRCAIQAERRNSGFPLIVARGKTYVLNLQPGETRELHLIAPDEPPLYQPPDLVEISTAADIAAYFGADAAADALESLVDQLANGEWDADTVQEIIQELQNSRGEDMEIEVEDLDGVEPELPSE